jgi:DNA-binding Lrp family transcriptional regulator
VDTKDFLLLAALYENSRQSYRTLGLRVSLSAPAVRERLKRLRATGVIQGHMVSVNSSLFGRREQLVWFLDGGWTDKDAQKALAVKDVWWVALKMDSSLTVQALSRDPSQTVEDLSVALGARPTDQALAERKSHRPLSGLEWEIIDALVDEPTMSLGKRIKLTRLSAKTVRKHLERLLGEEVLFITPHLGQLSDSGELIYTIAVFGKVGFAEIRRILGDAFMINQLQQPPVRYLLARANDLGEVTTKTRSLAKQDGVESVKVTLNRELLVSNEFMHGLIREQISASKKEATDITDLPPTRAGSC